MGALLKTEALTIAFGGHVAVNNVSFQVEENQFKSIIGPNGAGKTTLFNMLSGQLKPTSGKIWFDNKEVTHLAPADRTRLGIGRSFQLTNVFPNLTVLENVRLAVQSHAGVRFQMFRKYTRYKQFEEKAYGLLKSVFLENKAASLAKHLAHGEQRKLEIAMLLALEPRMMLLDEPTAGMSVDEVPAILEVIQRLKEEGKRTILLIEHKMDMVLELSDTMMVLHNGECIAEGTPKEIMDNDIVQTAYLGGFIHDVS
ncbi:MAG: ABC transporter ATP-binding protein [Tuberibacillus sp.]